MENIMENMPVLTEIQCFGNVLFWNTLIKSGQIIFEQHEHFQKSGYRNRYMVLGANGVITLSIPVVGGRVTRELTNDVLIDHTQNWQKSHWRTLESCYNKSPFFYHYAPVLQPLFQKKFIRLWDFDLEAFKWVEKQLKIQLMVTFTGSYQKKVPVEEINDCRGKNKTSGRTGYSNTPYFQVFNQDFQQNLSILDILFNLGPESSSYLLRQTTI